MKQSEWYDSGSGLHAASLLPAGVAAEVQALQAQIQEEVESKNPGKFLPSSGWRSDSGNRAVGGVVDSDHIWGRARDFVPGPELSCPPVVCSAKYQVIPSRGCWHVRLRG